MFTPNEFRNARTLKKAAVQLRDRTDFSRTVILATIGPKTFKSSDPKVQKKPETISATKMVPELKDMVKAGMYMVRINLAHVKTKPQREWVCNLLEAIRKVVCSMKIPIGVTVDLAGPKIRVENITRGDIVAGENIRLTTDNGFSGNKRRNTKEKTFSMTVEGGRFNIRNIEPECKVSMDDGHLRLEVHEVVGNDIICEAQNEWQLNKGRGVNFPGRDFMKKPGEQNGKTLGSALTSKDRRDLKWLFDENNGVARDMIDYVSLSFVKKPEDLTELIILLRDFGQGDTRVIAKIETAEAVEIDSDKDYGRFRSILDVSDGIMVAMGDLGAEIHFEDVPRIQKALVEITHNARKPVIVATEMLSNMENYGFATRAEATDIAIAVSQGADVTMLSGETSKGIDPRAAVCTMRTIAEKALEDVSACFERPFVSSKSSPILDLMANAAVVFAEALANVKCIVSVTDSGDTPIKIACYWPKHPVIAITNKRKTVARLRPYRGIMTFLVNYMPKNSDEHRDLCMSILQGHNITEPGDLAVMTLSMETIRPEDRITDTLHVLKHD